MTLGTYIPDNISLEQITAQDYIRAITDDAERGRSSKINVSYYKPPGRDQPVISATDIPDEIRQTRDGGEKLIPRIDWTLYPEDHPLHHKRTTTWNPEERRLVRPYLLTRGRILHRRILLVQTDDIFDALDEMDKDIEAEKSRLKDAPLESIRDRLAESDDAPLIHADTPPDELPEKAHEEALRAKENWNQITDGIEMDTVRDEAILVNDDYGSQIDRIAHVTDGLPEGLYAVEIKLSEERHPKHLMQAEAYRRALGEKLGELPEAAVIRLTVEDDGEIITTHDEEWPSEELWNRIQTRVERIWDSLVPVYLKNSIR